MEYHVVISQGTNIQKVLEDFEERINDWCKRGWKPQGGVSLVIKGTYIYLSQAIVH